MRPLTAIALEALPLIDRRLRIHERQARAEAGEFLRAAEADLMAARLALEARAERVRDHHSKGRYCDDGAARLLHLIDDERRALADDQRALGEWGAAWREWADWSEPLQSDPTQEEPLIVYALLDPRTEEVRYIGQSRRGLQRTKEHIYRTYHDASNPPKWHWLSELKRNGLLPDVRVLEQLAPTQFTDLLAAEKRWIAHGRQAGWPLLNKSAGG